MQDTDWKTLVPSILGGINTLLMSVGAYHLPNEGLDALVKVVSGLIMLYGIIAPHKKKAR